jgi:hypothetical protein
MLLDFSTESFILLFLFEILCATPAVPGLIRGVFFIAFEYS